MENVRCVIACMPQQILADIVQTTVEDSGLFEVVARVDSATDVETVVTRHSAEVLILGMQNTDLPSSFVDSIKRITNLLIIGLVDDGRRLMVLLDNASKSDIAKIIKALHRPNEESRHTSE